MERDDDDDESLADFEVLDGADFDDDDNTIGDPPPQREPARTLGDAGASNDDESYTGEVSTAPLSLDYFRSKFREFQITLNSLDVSYRAAQNAMQIPGVDQSVLVSLRNASIEYENRRSTLKRTAELLNAGASLANNAGLRLPVISLPQTLGIPFVVPIAIAGAVATAVSLVIWGNGLIATFRTHILRAQAYANLTPEGRGALAVELAKIDAAQQESTGTGLSSVAGAVKWVAIGALAYFAWRAFQSSRGDD